MKRGIVVLFLISVLFLNLVGSDDLVSVNSGGDLQLCIDSGGFESCFTGGESFCVPASCLSLGYECGTVSDGCGITLNCGSCSSGYTCSSGTCVAEGGGGGGGGTTTSSSISLTMLNGTYQEKTIGITNNGANSQTVFISEYDPDKIISFETSSITLSSGETKYLNVTILSPIVEGNYSGTITIGSQKVYVSVVSKSKFLLFDSNIVILNSNYKVMQSDLLKTKVELTPMGDPERLDVTLNYVVSDTSGKVYLTQSETVLVEDKVTIYRNFETGMLPLGNYVVAVVLIIGILIDIALIIIVLARIAKRRKSLN